MSKTPAHTPKPLPIDNKGKYHDVPIALLRTPPALFTQREFRKSWGDTLAANLALEQLGTIYVNRRDGLFWIVDGQHRIYALRERGFGDSDITCWVYENLTDKQMAEKFLKLNTKLNVDTFSKFHVSCTMDDPRATAIRRVVESNGAKISRAREENCVSAIAALGKVHDRGGEVVLGQVIRTLRTAYNGDPGAFHGGMVEGLGLAFTRYNGLTNESLMVSRLASTPLGVRGLLRRAADIRMKTGSQTTQCIAAVIVDTYNRGAGRGIKRLPDWWKADKPDRDENSKTK